MRHAIAKLLIHLAHRIDPGVPNRAWENGFIAGSLRERAAPFIAASATAPAASCNIAGCTACEKPKRRPRRRRAKPSPPRT